MNRRTLTKGLLALSGVAFSETAGAQQRWRTLRIENTVDRRNVVEVWVTGDVRRGDGTEDEDRVGDGRVRSVLTDRSAADTFEFTGRIRRIRWSEAEPRVLVDGDRIDPEEYRADGDDDWQVMRVFNTVDRRNVVDVRVTGDVRKGDEAEREDIARRGFARSVLSDRSAVDSFEFTGRITDVSWSERRPEITVDGRTVDLDRFDDDDRDLPSYLRLTGPRNDSVRVYVRVTGRIDALAGDEGDSSPRVADVRVGGRSYPRVREFRYSGRIFQLATAEGDVAIDIQQRDD
ncbi:hypothetical protein [Haloarcula nitratireducens]|uniref:DUF5666 domain-containing protein n=1 Tax=Haloarcula nitratireducens TaxID=2487749 RepID=A0AAW4PE96_9EURY|nr:hypothetical protein [Halomicroarcula nitratireducens]MBX0295572.1 hypothetical protein [Halomicroarcula nitratireducens]